MSISKPKSVRQVDWSNRCLIGVLPRTHSLWVGKFEPGSLVVSILWSPELRLLCPVCVAVGLCRESTGGTKIRRGITLGGCSVVSYVGRCNVNSYEYKGTDTCRRTP